MLKELFPRVHRRYSSLPVLGAVMDGFAEYLVAQGYPRIPRCRHVRAAQHIDKLLKKRGCLTLAAITHANLLACAPPPGHSQDNPDVAAAVRLLTRYLDERGFLPPSAPPSLTEMKLADYETYLRQVRGLAPSTIKHHVTTASRFISHLDNHNGLSRLPGLTPLHIEEFVKHTGGRLSRESLQHSVAQLRSFLRFLGTRGDAPAGLGAQIDTARVYRGERLPHALPWETVRALLASINRTTPMGLRDYAMFVLITTYGLRACEVVGLKLEEIEWRMGRIHVRQRKTASPLLLPLTGSVGDSLLSYIRRGRPAIPCREIFVRHRAPAGILKPTAVTEAFQAMTKRSGLNISFQGPHCLRHSYAVHLLRLGTPLKTIGDMLGHRNAESTCVYLRLAVEDLRGVALELPLSAAQEVRS